MKVTVGAIGLITIEPVCVAPWNTPVCAYVALSECVTAVSPVRLNDATPLESGDEVAGLPSTLSEMLPVGVPFPELAVTVTGAASP